MDSVLENGLVQALNGMYGDGDGKPVIVRVRFKKLIIHNKIKNKIT